MNKYSIRFYGVQFSDDRLVDEIIEPISVREYNDLVEGDCDTFFSTYQAIRARVENCFGLVFKYVTDWDAMKV